jgi:SAM-dependent methyltransferase
MSRTWDYYGARDPYFGVLSSPEYHGKLDPASAEKFFATGVTVVNRFAEVAESAFGPVPRGAALDYGCGVGRLSRHLATRFERVTGVDISHEMLREARRNIGDAPGVELVHASELQAGARFDFLMSSIVFQHIEPAAGLEILRRISRMLKVGGVGVIDIPVSYKGSVARRVLRKLRAAVDFGKPIIPMYWYSETKVSAVLEGFDVRIDHFDSSLFTYAMVAFRRIG